MSFSKTSDFEDNESFIIKETNWFDVFREDYASMKLCFESYLRELYIKSSNERLSRLFIEFYVFHVVRNFTEIMISHESEMKDKILLLFCG